MKGRGAHQQRFAYLDLLSQVVKDLLRIPWWV